MTFSKQFPSTISTNQSSIPNIPQFSVENPLKKQIFCNGIEVVCTPEFTRKGAMVIRVNNVDLYDSRKTKGFERVGKLPIALDAELERDMKVEIFIINEVDSNLIECTVNIFLDEFSKTLDSSLTYISDDVVNSQVSDEQILFPVRTYLNENPTVLLDMKGYTKLIINMSAQEYISPLVIVNFGTRDNPPFSNPENAVDGILTTASNHTVAVNTGDANFTDTMVVEFPDNLPKIPVAKFRVQTQITLSSNSGTVVVKVFHSEDNIIFTQFDTTFTQTLPDTTAKDNTVTKTGTTVNFKFIKIEFVRTFTTTSYIGTNGVFEIFDSNELGGTAGLSFNELNIADNTFTEFISSSEFGTVTIGTAVKVQLGDISNLGASGRTFILPSTQTGFQAQLTITGGGIRTGVAIRLIS